jgi:hypothetical protein
LERERLVCASLTRPSPFFQDALFVRVRLIVCFDSIAEKYSVMPSSQIAFSTTSENINSHFSSGLSRLIVTSNPASPTKSFSTLIFVSYLTSTTSYVPLLLNAPAQTLQVSYDMLGGRGVTIVLIPNLDTFANTICFCVLYSGL